jgi:hypothetical protein
VDRGKGYNAAYGVVRKAIGVGWNPLVVAEAAGPEDRP